MVKLRNEAAEAVYSATYIEDYFDAVENLPDDVQRLVSRLKELDIETQNNTRDVNAYMDQVVEIRENKDKDRADKDKEVHIICQHIQRLLIRAQDIGDEKIQIGQQLQDYVENRFRQLELDKKTLDAATRPPEARERDMGGLMSDTSSLSFPDDQPTMQKTTSTTVKRNRRARLDPSISSNKDAGFSDFFQPSPVTFKETPATTTSLSTYSKKKKDKEKDKDKETEKDNDVPAPATTSIRESKKQRHISESDQDHTTVTESRRSESSSTRTPRKTSSLSADPPPAKRQYNSHKSDKRKSESRVSTRDKDRDRDVESDSSKRPGKKPRKTRQVGHSDDSPSISLPIDPDEPRYCLCDQISFGEMVGCDNDLCPIEWFHFNCVSLTSKPKGKWYCPKCRGDRPNVMKNKAIFLKELEEYNREKEEKS